MLYHSCQPGFKTQSFHMDLVGSEAEFSSPAINKTGRIPIVSPVAAQLGL